MTEERPASDIDVEVERTSEGGEQTDVDVDVEKDETPDEVDPEAE